MLDGASVLDSGAVLDSRLYFLSFERKVGLV